MKSIIYNDDGWSSYMRYPAPMSPEDIVRVTLQPVTNTNVSVYQFCSLGGHAVNYNSSFLPRVGETMESIDTMHVWRMRETLRYLDSLGTDPLSIVSNACHQRNIACQFSLRMNDAHHTYTRSDGSLYFPELYSPWFDAHPEALLENRQLDYAHSDVHTYRIAQITEVLEKYNIDGIDLDFTRFKPFFKPGLAEAGMPAMTELLCKLRELTGRYNKTLSARFEYSPASCIESGLDVENWLNMGLLNQITLGGIGDHTPDAPSIWWTEHAHPHGCKVFPGIEGQLHWLANSGGGGIGIRPGDGADDGYGPPSIEYMRAVASVHYMNDADGLSMFNFTCADGPFPRSAFVELADPEAMKFKDKQYVGTMWEYDAQIYGMLNWNSRFRLDPNADSAIYEIRIADDMEQAAQCNISPDAVLTLDIMGINTLEDIQITVNGIKVHWNGYRYNHYDCGCWNDVLKYNVPQGALHLGTNQLEIRRLKRYEGFVGPIEIRKLICNIRYPESFMPGTGIC